MKLKEKIKQLLKRWRKWKCKVNWHDYKDAYPFEDGHEPVPLHFHDYTCRFCKKKFTI